MFRNVNGKTYTRLGSMLNVLYVISLGERVWDVTKPIVTVLNLKP